LRDAGDRTETKAHERAQTDVRLRQTPKSDRQAAGSSCFGSWETTSRTASHRLRCHRCEQPLRVVLPPTGWVTALAGLLAHGSLPDRPAFPVSQWL